MGRLIYTIGHNMNTSEVLDRLQRLVFDLDIFKYIESISYEIKSPNHIHLIIKFESNSFKYRQEDLQEYVSNTLSYIKVIGNYDIKIEYIY